MSENLIDKLNDHSKTWEHLSPSFWKSPKNLVVASHILKFKIIFVTSTIEMVIAMIPKISTPKYCARTKIVRAENKPAKILPKPKILKFLKILL